MGIEDHELGAFEPASDLLVLAAVERAQRHDRKQVSVRQAVCAYEDLHGSSALVRGSIAIQLCPAKSSEVALKVPARRGVAASASATRSRAAITTTVGATRTRWSGRVRSPTGACGLRR
ncbi:MAG: hypothetical protein WA687_02540 [Solirubrobacterales bacterium]